MGVLWLQHTCSVVSPWLPRHLTRIQTTRGFGFMGPWAWSTGSWDPGPGTQGVYRTGVRGFMGAWSTSMPARWRFACMDLAWDFPGVAVQGEMPYRTR